MQQLSDIDQCAYYRSQSSATPSDAGSTEAKDLQQSPKVEKPRVRVNPFGDARPREEILKEQEQKQVTTTEDKPSGADEVGTEETSNRREPEAAEKVATTEEPKDVSEKETSSEANGKSVENSESQWVPLCQLHATCFIWSWVISILEVWLGVSFFADLDLSWSRPQCCTARSVGSICFSSLLSLAMPFLSHPARPLMPIGNSALYGPLAQWQCE